MDKVKGIGFKNLDNKLILNSPNLLVTTKYVIDLPGYAWELLQKHKPFDLYRAHYWHTFFSEKDRTPFAAVYSSLGCKFGCNFCMINIVNRTSLDESTTSANSKLMHHWDPKHFVDQLEILANYGVKQSDLQMKCFF